MQFSASKPIYLQVMEDMKREMVTGDLPAGSRVESVRVLAGRYGINLNTMQRACSELEREGLVHSQRTAGRFVTEDRARIQQAKRQCAEEQIQTFLEKMEQLGYTRAEILQLMEQQGKGDG